MAKENNGVALADLYDADGNLQAKKASCSAHLPYYVRMVQRHLLAGFYTGSWTEKGKPDG